MKSGMSLAGLLGCMVLLASCGGGGGGATSGTPTPTPNPTPTPTPTPNPTTGEIRPPADAVVAASRMDLIVNGTTTSNRFALLAPHDFSLTFDPANAQYHLTDPDNSAVFGSAQFTKETSVPDFFPRVEWESHATSTDDYLVIFKAPNATPPVTPRYGAYGAWQHNSNSGGGPFGVRLIYFAYGSPTPSGSMPHTGRVTYRIVGTANYADDSRLFFAQTDTLVTVDFVAGTVSGTVALTGADFFGDNLGGLLGVSLPGTINGNVVDAPLSSTIATLTGQFHLQFLGPNADELELTYEGNDPREAFAGAAIGTRQN